MTIRYRVRTLLLLVTVCAVLMGYCAFRFRTYREKQERLRRLSDVSSTVLVFERAASQSMWKPDTPIPLSEWIVGNFPSLDVVCVVVGPEVEHRVVLSDVLELLHQYPTITELDFSLTQLVDEDISVLAASCPNITKLDVSQTNLTDRSTAALARLKKLRILEASWTQLTGAGFRVIGESCQDLARLDLSYSRVNNAGIAEIVTCTSLRELDISGNDVKPKALEIIASSKMNRLLNLYLPSPYKNYSEDEYIEFVELMDRLHARYPRLNERSGAVFFE